MAHSTQLWIVGHLRSGHHCPELLRWHSHRPMDPHTTFWTTIHRVFAWEVDPQAIIVAKKHLPDIITRGNFMDDDPEDIAQLIRDYDPDGTKLILWLSAPPCPDFSSIKGDEAPGKEGPEGQKFLRFTEFANSVEERLPNKKFGYLVENVILQDRGEADLFSLQMNCNVVAIDAADYGLINRPRLWWSRIQWDQVKVQPFTGRPLRWGKLQGFPRIYVDEPHQEADQLELDSMTLRPSVVAHTHRIPCLTTPAPSESGRAAPKKLKGRIPPDAKARWLQDSRQYAPWQYQAEALLHDTKGQMHVPTPEAKEQFHQLPRGFTNADGVSTRARHRMLANGWHAGVARLMLFLVVSQLCQRPTQAALPPQIELSTLQWIQQQLCGYPGLIGPGGWPSQPSCIPPGRYLPQRHTHWTNRLSWTQACSRPCRSNANGNMTLDVSDAVWSMKWSRSLTHTTRTL